MKTIIYIILILIGLIIGLTTLKADAQFYNFISSQLAPNPQNGDVAISIDGLIDWVATSTLGITGGSGSPGGSTTQVQFNNAGSFAGDSGMTYSSSTDTLSVVSINATNSTSTRLAVTSSFNLLGDIITNVATWFQSYLDNGYDAVFGSATTTHLSTTNATTTRLAVTGTGTTTFAGGINVGTNHIVTHGVQSDASDGLHIHAGNGTDVGLFGAGNTANSLFYGAVNIDGNTRIATATNGVLVANAGAITASGTPTVATLVATSTTGTSTFANAVGIGTTTPIGRLEIANNTNGGNVSHFTNTNTGSGAYSEFNIRNANTSDAFGDGLRMLTLGTGWSTVGAFVQDGSALMTGSNLAGGMSLATLGASANMRFYTAGFADANERMRITSGGLVGIGTTSPVTTLAVNGSTTITSNLQVNGRTLFVDATNNRIGIGTTTPIRALSIVDNRVVPLSIQNLATTTTSYSGVHFVNASGTTAGHMGYANPTVSGALSDKFYFGSILTKDLVLTTDDTVRMTIKTSSGNIGIGTTTPTKKLSVIGDMTLTGAFFDSIMASGTANQILTSTGTSTLWTTPSSLCVAITGSADLCDGSDDGGGGGGGALSTTTDIIGVPTDTLQEVSYVTGDVMFGGNSSTTAEFQLDDDGAQLIISSTTNSNATATIESGNNAQAVRIGDDSGVGIENIFSTAGKIITRFYGSITEWIMDLAKVAITGKLYVATTTYNGATTSDALVIDGFTNSGEWMEEFCTSAGSETSQITADTSKGCGRYSYIEDVNGVLDFDVPNSATSSYFRLRAGATGGTNVAGDGMGIGWYQGLLLAYAHKNLPTMEWTMRQNTMANATSTFVFGGMTNAVGTAANFAAEPTVGFYVIATSTANWQFACNPFSGSTVYVDTGIASSTTATALANPFVHFRLEVSGTSSTAVTAILKARTVTNQNMTQVGSCTLNLSGAAGFIAPTVALGKSTAGSSPELHVNFIKFWYKQPVF